MVTPRRILFLHPSAELYGADRTLLDLIARLDPKEYDVHVAIPGDGPLLGELRSLGAQVHDGPLGVAAASNLTPTGLLRLARDLPKSIYFLRKLIRKIEPDVVHTNTMVVLGGAIAAGRSRAAHLWHIHEIPTRPKALPRLAAWLMTRYADQVVFNSHATAHTFLRHSRTLWKRSVVVHNGIDPTRLNPLPEKETARERLGWPQSSPIALLIGRINSWKGQPVAVEAMALLHRRRPDLRLAIVGGPPPGQEHFETSLDARIAEAGLGEAILRGRFTPEVADLYRAADLILVPSSRPEPFGLVTLEAFAAGRAALVSGHGGPTEIVERGVTGDWFEPDNAQDLADRLLALIEDPRTLQAMGQRARRVQKLRFSLASHVARFQRLYQILPDSCQHMDRSSGLGDTPRIIHAVLGRANPARMNGVNRVVHGLASRQSLRMPIEVWGLCEHPDAPTPPRPYRLVTWPRSKRRRRLAPGLLGELDRITSWPPSQRPIFHLHGAFLPEWSTLSKELRARGLEYVFTAHGAYVPAALGKGRLRKALYRRLFETRLVRGARSVQALSPEEQAAMERCFPGSQVVLVPPGQDPEPVARIVRKAGRRGLRVGSLGRLDAHTKGLDLLLDGFAAYVAQGGQGHLTLAGDGPDRAALEKQVQRLGIASVVTFLGEVHGEAKRAFLMETDVLAQLSRHEGLPGAPLEAAALGCPLLISEGTHLGDSVRTHGAGKVLESCSPESVAEGLIWFAACTDEVNLRLARGARAMIERDYSWAERTRRMERDLYRLQPPEHPPAEAA